MKRILAATAIAASLFTLPARAEIVDLATVKCSELTTMDKEELGTLFIWMLGYSGGQTGTTTLDLSAMETLGTGVGQYCADNPDVGLLSAATTVLSE
jgi:acid stress chaperone HdeB